MAAAVLGIWGNSKQEAMYPAFWPLCLFLLRFFSGTKRGLK